MAEMERAREQGNEEGIGELISSIGRLLYKKQGPQEIGTPPFPVCFHAYIFFFVAASGVFGDFRQVNDTPFWDVMLYIYKCRFEMLHNNKKQ